MFDVDNLIEQCHGAIGESDPRRAVREVLLKVLVVQGVAVFPLDGSEPVHEEVIQDEHHVVEED